MPHAEGERMQADKTAHANPEQVLRLSTSRPARVESCCTSLNISCKLKIKRVSLLPSRVSREQAQIDQPAAEGED